MIHTSVSNAVVTFSAASSSTSVSILDSSAPAPCWARRTQSNWTCNILLHSLLVVVVVVASPSQSPVLSVLFWALRALWWFIFSLLLSWVLVQYEFLQLRKKLDGHQTAADDSAHSGPQSGLFYYLIGPIWEPFFKMSALWQIPLKGLVWRVLFFFFFYIIFCFSPTSLHYNSNCSKHSDNETLKKKTASKFLIVQPNIPSWIRLSNISWLSSQWVSEQSNSFTELNLVVHFSGYLLKRYLTFVVGPTLYLLLVSQADTNFRPALKEMSEPLAPLKCEQFIIA